MLIDRLVNYLKDTLNVTVSVRQWDVEGRLPLFLRDGYLYCRANIHDLEFLLMVDSSEETRPPSMVGKHLEQVRTKWGGDVVYVREQVDAYIRKRLVDAGIQFIVPGNQLYLPALAIDLREYYRQRRVNVQKFSPATQALLLYWIYNEGVIDREKTTPTEMANILGYTKMTMSRAFKEVDSGLDEGSADGGAEKKTKAQLSGRELWERFEAYWRDPVNRRYYLLRKNFDRSIGLRAGLSALASYSMLAEPQQKVCAVSRNEWRALSQRQDVQVLGHPDSQTVEVEIWIYPPELFARNGRKGAVDPLSLYLALKGNKDERVEKALEELLRGVEW